jgi:exonuclease V
MHDDSSDYGSDFTPDEQELLNELLETVTATTTTTTTVSESESESEKQPPTPEQIRPDLQTVQHLFVTDIEDYEVPHPARSPRVLGREAWSASRRVWLTQKNLQPSSPSLHKHASASGMLHSLL